MGLLFLALAETAPLSLAADQSATDAGRLGPGAREALTLGVDQVLFVKRKTYQSSHYYTEYIDGCRFYGGNLAVFSCRDGTTRDLVPQFTNGIFGRFDLSFDAKRVVFDYKPGPGKGFRIFEVGIDGTGLRQLTADDPEEEELIRKYRTVGTPTGIRYDTGTDDMHPCYLPDGGIAFISTRCRKGILCDAPDVLTTTVLYRMNGDGGAMHPISYNSVSEATPTVTEDGRILYTRWEYVDKGGSACKCIWSMRPDGSGSMEVYANNITHPTTFIDCRDIPGYPGSYVVVGAPHMPLGVGSIIKLDTRLSLKTTAVMTSLTPEIETPDEHGYRHLRDGKWVHDLQGPLLREPYPLSDRDFLVAYNPDKPWNEPTGYSIYLLNGNGERKLVWKEADYSCWEPYPLRARKRPPVLPAVTSVAGTGTSGTMFLQDVYQGLTGIQRGTVKYLRVMEDVPRPWSARRFWGGDDIGQQHAAVSWGGHLAVKIDHGIVPVESDGSAFFTVPANRNIFLQALDANYMEVQRMRTFVNILPGENRGCVGCHEERSVVPVAGRAPLAAFRPPSVPSAEPGATVPRAMHYPTEVQPVLDQYCVRCHSGPYPKGIDLSGTLTQLFSVSYEALLKQHWAGNVVDEIGISGRGGKHANIEAAPPLTYGSHTSKLIELLRKGHYDVQLPTEAMVRLLTWIDANAPYYGTYEGRRSLTYKDLPDFRPLPAGAPGELAHKAEGPAAGTR